MWAKSQIEIAIFGLLVYTIYHVIGYNFSKMPLSLDKRPKRAYRSGIFHTLLGSTWPIESELKSDWTVKNVPSLVVELLHLYLLYSCLSMYDKNMVYTAWKRRRFPTNWYKTFLQKSVHLGNTRSILAWLSWFFTNFSQKTEINYNHVKKWSFLFYTIL